MERVEPIEIGGVDSCYAGLEVYVTLVADDASDGADVGMTCLKKRLVDVCDVFADPFAGCPGVDVVEFDEGVLQQMVVVVDSGGVEAGCANGWKVEVFFGDKSGWLICRLDGS